MEAGGSGHWDDPEGWDGEGGGFRMGNSQNYVYTIVENILNFYLNFFKLKI